MELTEKTKVLEEAVRHQMNRYIETNQSPYVKTAMEAMEYSVLAGGKRLRPLLMSETFYMIAGQEGTSDQKHALEVFMTALEMIHTYSLVHDDLPALDNDSSRRGKETTWKKYGEWMGVLGGDALLHCAFEIVFQLLEEYGEPGKEEFLPILLKCASLLARKAGIPGMLGGQIADVETEKSAIPMTMERIVFIHAYKTAALIEAAFCIGGILAGAGGGEVTLLGGIAHKVGIAFQIQDDILDVEGDSAVLGKPVGSDAANGKETYVNLVGLEASRQEVKALSEEAITLLQRLSGNHEYLEELIRYLIYRQN